MHLSHQMLSFLSKRKNAILCPLLNRKRKNSYFDEICNYYPKWHHSRKWKIRNIFSFYPNIDFLRIAPLKPIQLTKSKNKTIWNFSKHDERVAIPLRMKLTNEKKKNPNGCTVHIFCVSAKLKLFFCFNGKPTKKIDCVYKIIL